MNLVNLYVAPNEQSVCIPQVGVRVSSAGEGDFGAGGAVGGAKVELGGGENGSRDTLMGTSDGLWGNRKGKRQGGVSIFLA